MNEDGKINKNITIIKYEQYNDDFLKYIEIYKNTPKVYDFLYNKVYKNINISSDKSNKLTRENIDKINEMYSSDFDMLDYVKK